MLFYILGGAIVACSLGVVYMCVRASRPMKPLRPDDQEWTSEVGFWGQQ